MTLDGQPEVACSVVICAYNSRRRIDRALETLHKQDFDEPFEIIAVVSGDDDCEVHLAAQHPHVRVVVSPTRLYPGAARNKGVAAARGKVIAFLPDDGLADRHWLRARVEKHREGYALVGGAISNATPRSWVGTAGYFVEYAASMPIERLLQRQSIPHTLSYDRSVFDQLGLFPQVEHPGEDTLFNARCIAAELPVAYEPRAHLGHVNLTRFWPYVMHQADHGRGLARCVIDHRFAGPFDVGHGISRLAFEALVRYPFWRWWRTLELLSAAAPQALPRFVALTPLIVAGYLAGALGAFRVLVRAKLHATRHPGARRPRATGVQADGRWFNGP